MPINGVQPLGDDQRWKAEVEKEIRRLTEMVKVLQSQANARSK